jgi:hypothetical protein
MIVSKWQRVPTGQIAKLRPRLSGATANPNVLSLLAFSTATQPPGLQLSPFRVWNLNGEAEREEHGVVCLLAPGCFCPSLLPAPIPVPARATAQPPLLPTPSPRHLSRCFLRRVAGGPEGALAIIFAAGLRSVGEYPQDGWSWLDEK